MAAGPINDEQIEALDRLLHLRAVPFGGLGIEGLDGFMTALLVGPGTPAVGDAFDAAWGPQPPRWENEADRGQALALFEALWRTVERRLRHDGDALPPALLPIWWMPEDPDAEHPDDTPIGAAWAEGFRLGSERETETWQAWLEQADWLHDAFALIDDLEVGTTFEDDGETERPLRYRERLDTYALLPDLLFDLQQHRIERLTPREPVRATPLPGRNEPCPCGSGRKFKHCCGSGRLDA